MSSLTIKIFSTDGVQILNAEKSHVTIGAASSCEVCLIDEGVGAEHLRIWMDGDHLWAQDLGCEGGTLMNGTLMTPLRPILFRETDSFKLGKSERSVSVQPPHVSFVRPPAPPKKPEPVAVLPEVTNSVSQDRYDQLKEENDRLVAQVAELHIRLTRNAEPSQEEITQVSQVKRDALKEIEATKEAEMRRFESWKRDSVYDVENAISSLILAKPKKMLSKDEVRREISAGLRHALLGEPLTGSPRSSEDGSRFRMLLALFSAGLICAGYIVLTKKKVTRVEASTATPVLNRAVASPAPAPAARVQTPPRRR